MPRPRDTSDHRYTSGWWSGQRAVTPVVAVLLVVAVTLILGLVTAGFVLDIAEETDTEVPQATFEYDLNTTTGELTVTHHSGEKIDGDTLGFGGAALEKDRIGGIDEWRGQTVSAGNSATVTVQADETLLIRWENLEEQESAVIGEYDVPLFAGTDARITGASSGSAGYSGTNHVEVTINNFATPTGELFVRIENCDTGAVATETYQQPIPNGEWIDLGSVKKGI